MNPVEIPGVSLERNERKESCKDFREFPIKQRILEEYRPEGVSESLEEYWKESREKSLSEFQEESLKKFSRESSLRETLEN